MPCRCPRSGFRRNWSHLPGMQQHNISLSLAPQRICSLPSEGLSSLSLRQAISSPPSRPFDTSIAAVCVCRVCRVSCVVCVVWVVCVVCVMCRVHEIGNSPQATPGRGAPLPTPKFYQNAGGNARLFVLLGLIFLVRSSSSSGSSSSSSSSSIASARSCACVCVCVCACVCVCVCGCVGVGFAQEIGNSPQARPGWGAPLTTPKF